MRRRPAPPAAHYVTKPYSPIQLRINPRVPWRTGIGRTTVSPVCGSAFLASTSAKRLLHWVVCHDPRRTSYGPITGWRLARTGAASRSCQALPDATVRHDPAVRSLRHVIKQTCDVCRCLNTNEIISGWRRERRVSFFSANSAGTSCITN
jgi:hypothetical protein